MTTDKIRVRSRTIYDHGIVKCSKRVFDVPHDNATPLKVFPAKKPVC